MRGIILGAGMTGLAAGYKTGYPIYEASDQPGGICRSYFKQGYLFDNGGGHWIFGSGEVFNFLNKFSKFEFYKRDAGVYFNTIMPYPIQGYLEKEDAVTAGSMKSWMRVKFSNELCKMFFHPFNKKYTDGMYDSIIQDDPGKSPDPRGSGYNDTFAYPTRGLSTMVDKLAGESEIRYNKEAAVVDLEKKVVTFKDGDQVEYDRLISTIPLKRLLSISGVQEAKDFPYTSVVCLNIGAERGKNCPDNHWLYVPYCKSGFYRVGFYSNVHGCAPRWKVSLYVEKATDMDQAIYKKDAIKELQDWGFIGQVEYCDSILINYAYTWMFPHTKREWALAMLKSKGVDSIGRYGSWRFQGIAQSVEQGLGM